MGRADNRDDSGRVFQQPGQRGDAAGDAAFARHEVEDFAGVNAMRVVRSLQVNRPVVGEPPARQRTPRHRRDVFRQTLVEGAVVKAIQLQQIDFHLVRDQRHRAGPLQRGKLRRPEIAHAELADLPGFFQFAECARRFFGIAQVIGPMQLVEVDRLHAESFERLLARADDVLRAEIVAIGRVGVRVAPFANAALGRDQHAFAHAGNFLEGLSENLFADALAINVRKVEQHVARLKCGSHRLAAPGLGLRGDFAGFPGARNAPAAVREPAARQRTLAQLNGLHRQTLSCLRLKQNRFPAKRFHGRARTEFESRR